MSEPLIEIRGLSKYFPVESTFFGKPTSWLKAVDDVDLTIYKGEALGLVGESGCGKTTIGKLICNLYQPTSGEIIYNGTNLTHLNMKERRKFAREIQLIFQDPYASLNPRMRVSDIIAEPIRIHKLLPEDQIDRRVQELLDCVGLGAHFKERYPHEFSGGQRQRIGIARALAVNPKLIVCDEPVSALDVSVQAQVLNLLDDLKEEFGLTYLFIAHGLNVVKHISDRVGVMYLGHIVELAEKNEIYNNPQHPYTKALLSAIPSIDPGTKRNRIILQGDVPSPIDPPNHCRFIGRCYERLMCCEDVQQPRLMNVGNDHHVACYRFSEHGCDCIE